jgi:DNA (cytosine-5)-methyltransferase 1
MSFGAGGVSFASASSENGFWSDAEWITGADGKARRVEPGVRLLAHGVPARVAKLRALGNAIVPQVAAEFVKAYLEADLLV